MKKASSDYPGGEEIEDGIEMAGWGVEEADKKNKSEASTYTLLSTLQLGLLTHMVWYRSRHPTGISIRDPQILHLHSGPAHDSHNAKGR